MDKVRLGIIGLGNMGAVHAAQVLDGQIGRCELAAVCDGEAGRLAGFAADLRFGDAAALFASGRVDAVLIATPHFSHVPLGIAALAAGLHVLVEKPVAVHKAEALRLLAAAQAHPAQVFAAMFNQRTDPRYRRLRGLLQSGELGAVRRVAWTVTDWFRTDAYYASGGWRASWAGEGGGVLLNQCPHNLDLWWWLFGQPQRVRAFCALGRHHPIEVEDEVSAFLEYADGTSGTFVTSTGEAPGTNRLEVAAERGKVVLEGGALSYWRNETASSEFCQTSAQGFARPEAWEVKLPAANGNGGQHNEILNNFVAAILDGAPLLAPGAEGIHSVELANAMILSSLQQQTVTLPLDAAAYEARLHELIANSKYVKPAPQTPAVAADFSQIVQPVARQFPSGRNRFSARPNPSPMKLEQVALQLYTLRDHLKTPADIAASLKKVRAIGYQAVQASGLGPIPEAELLSILDGEGLKLCATHEPSDRILAEPQAIVERLKKLDCTYTAYPYPAGIDFADLAQVRRLAGQLDAAGKVLHEAGLVLTYHNHAIELVRLGESTILDSIYEQTNPAYLQGEIDTYWIQYGGGDPVDWCQKLSGRLPLLHMKDYGFTTDNKPDFAEIGYGNLNWKKIIAAAENSGCRWFIIEQDTCPGDPFESVEKSFRYVSAHLCT